MSTTTINQNSHDTNLFFVENEKELQDMFVCPPANILIQLKKLPAKNCPNGKVFYRSYNSWHLLNNDQKNKTFIFYQSLPKDIKDMVTEAAMKQTEIDKEKAKLREERVNAILFKPSS